MPRSLPALSLGQHWQAGSSTPRTGGLNRIPLWNSNCLAVPESWAYLFGFSLGKILK